ncbi:MAG: 5-nucleotidase [Ilumatobacteraceae bacterium]
MTAQMTVPRVAPPLSTGGPIDGQLPHLDRDRAPRRTTKSWLTDMDGVLVHEGEPVPGAPEFINRIGRSGKPFLVLTNNSIYTPRDLQARLLRMGFDLPEEAIWTAALATAQFLSDQRPNGSAYVIGEAGLITAMHSVGYVMTDFSPDYVVLGETRNYSFEMITKAVRLINDGARFICTNPDATGPSVEGAMPAAGSVAAMISKATGVQPYFVGKPNPMMMRSALNTVDAHSESTAMIGDRMDTDILCGLEAGLETILVLTGISTREEAERYPYRPSRIVNSIVDLIDEI